MISTSAGEKRKMLGTNVPYPPSGDRNIDQLYDIGMYGYEEVYRYVGVHMDGQIYIYIHMYRYIYIHTCI